MTPAEALEHAQHLCDVWADVDDDDIHVGVIDQVYTTGWLAVVAGHPSYGTRVLPVRQLETTCRIGHDPIPPSTPLVSDEQAEYDDHWRSAR